MNQPNFAGTPPFQAVNDQSAQSIPIPPSFEAPTPPLRQQAPPPPPEQEQDPGGQVSAGPEQIARQAASPAPQETGSNGRRRITFPDNAIEFICTNSRLMTPAQMASELGSADQPISEKDVRNFMYRIKKNLRNGVVMQGQVEGVPAYALHNKKMNDGQYKSIPDFSRPLSEKARRLEQFIAQNIVLPVTDRSKNRKSAFSDSISSILDQI